MWLKHNSVQWILWWILDRQSARSIQNRVGVESYIGSVGLPGNITILDLIIGRTIIGLYYNHRRKLQSTTRTEQQAKQQCIQYEHGVPASTQDNDCNPDDHNDDECRAGRFGWMQLRSDSIRFAIVARHSGLRPFMIDWFILILLLLQHNMLDLHSK